MAASGISTTFFEELGRRKHEPLLRRETGTLRWDVKSADGMTHWFVEMNHGDVIVSQRNDAADVVLRSDIDVLDALVTGEQNAMATLLKGTLYVEGELVLALAMQRLFPGPPDSQRDPAPAEAIA